MISHHIHAALARERQQTLLAEAAAARQARQARPHRPRAAAAVARRSRHAWTVHWWRPAWWPLVRCRLLGLLPRSARAGGARRAAIRCGMNFAVGNPDSAVALCSEHQLNIAIGWFDSWCE